MKTEDMVLISVDDHVVEPPDMFERHTPLRWRERAPRVLRTPAGHDVWLFEGQQLPNFGLNAVAGKPPHRFGMDPTSFDDVRPGCWNVDARVRDMDANGVAASLCFPSFPQFCGQLFARCASKDPEFALAMVQAYNDWHVDDWCASHPGRFIPLGMPPLWEPRLMAAEVRRLAAKGCHAVSFSENPAKLGYPSWHSDHWDPFFQACADEGTLLCLHIGSGADMVLTALDAPVPVQISLQPLNIVQAAGDLIWSRAPQRFPALRIALSEGGIGWVPYYLERADFVYRQHGAWTGAHLGGRLPSEVFREHVLTCFIDDPIGIRMRHEIGVERITWECDYPHSDSPWPYAPERLADSLVGVPDREVELITHRNAMRWFRFDPFRGRPREQCTVGALRARSADWDVSIRDGGPPWVPREQPLTQAEKLAALGKLLEVNREAR
jgi:predicted TIM-barrel fold metal-dependent hydrolase